MSDDGITAATIDRKLQDTEAATGQLSRGKPGRRERLRLALEAAGVVSFEWDIKQDSLHRFTSSFAELPLTPENEPATFEDVCQVVHPDDRQHFIANVQAALKHPEGIYHNEFRIIRHDGEIVWFQERGRVEFDQHGQPEYLFGLAQDITRLKQTKQELRESQSRYAGIVESAMDAIITVDTDQRIIFFNAAAEKMFGCRAADTLGGSVERFIPERFHQSHRVHIEAFARDGTANRKMGSLDFIMARRANGEEFPAEASISQVSISGKKSFTAILRDISERKRTEDRLKEREEDLKRAQVVGQIGSWRLDVRNNVLTWSDENYRIFGVPEGTRLTYESFLDVVHPEDRQYVDECWQAGIHGEPYDLEHRLVVNGEVKWVREKAYLELDDKGVLLGGFGITQDITKRKLAELALRESNHRKDEFLAMLAHELRNPLAPISNAVQILRMTQGDNPAIQQTTSMVGRQVKHLVRLVDDLLDVSRVSRGKIKLKKETVCLADIISQAVETSQPLIDARNHQLRICLPQEDIRVDGDATRLAQVISNLLNNAAKYTDANGRISLTLESRKNRLAANGGMEAIVRVKDNGRGMELAALNNLFEIFYQVDRNLDRAEGGLGIGLYLVKSLVVMHGGHVEAFSEGRGRGSEFVIHLPCLPEKETGALLDAGNEIKTARGKHILLVDDNPDVADSMAMLLKLFGHEISMAYDGREAVEIALSEHPDVVLLDIGLPYLNGYEVCRTIRNAGLTDTVIVALTGYGQEEDRKNAMDAGFNYHLAKPVDSEKLEQLLADSPIKFKE